MDGQETGMGSGRETEALDIGEPINKADEMGQNIQHGESAVSARKLETTDAEQENLTVQETPQPIAEPFAIGAVQSESDYGGFPFPGEDACPAAVEEAFAVFPPSEPPAAEAKPAKTGRGMKALLAVAALLLVFGAGYAGGRLAMRESAEEFNAALEGHITAYLEETNSAVLYRDVVTNYASTGAVNELSVADVADLAADSVVEILTETEITSYNPFSSLFGGRDISSIAPGSGSGVILSENGYVLTSYHVIENSMSITVGLRNGQSFPAEVIGVDEKSDVAIIKITPETGEEWPDEIELVPAVLGDSSLLRVGSPVVAIGNPLGRLGGTVTAGYISALDRILSVGNNTYNLLQTDAAINGGNSGGGLFNAEGELIGLVMAKSSGISSSGMLVEGLGFAIPINDIKSKIEDLLNYGRVNRATLGVRLLDIMDERTAASYYVDAPGVYIITVEPSSNASYVGLQSGDRIVSIDGEMIESGDRVVEIIGNKQFNETMDMVIIRDGEEIGLHITLYEKAPEEGAAIPTATQ